MSGAVFAGLLAVGGAWFAQRPPAGPASVALVAPVDKSIPAEAFSALPRSPNDPARPAYFGVPIVEDSVAFVIDSDANMSPYLDSVASVTDAIVTALPQDETQLGICLATHAAPLTLDLAAVTPTTLAGARSTLFGRFASGRTDLAAAVRTTASWRPRQMFIVLARQPDPTLIELLIQRARQSGATAHVIALGPASRADFTAVARATGGSVRSVPDDELASTVGAYRAGASTTIYEKSIEP